MDESKPAPASNPQVNLSIKKLFSNSWDISLRTILRFIVIGVVSLFVGLFLMVIAWILAGAVLGSMIGLEKIGQVFSGQDTYLWLEIITNPKIQITAGIFLVLYILLSMALQALVAIATLMAIDRVGQPFSLGIVLQKAKTALFPYILLQILLGFLYIGSFGFFFMPLILVIFLLIFANYELILNNQSAFNALRRSVFLVTKNFGHVFIVILMLLGLQVGFQSLPGLLSQILSDEGYAGIIFIFLIFYIVAGFIFNWFTTVLMVTVYKQVREVSGSEGKGHVWWMWIIALIGWLILVGAIFFSYKLFWNLISSAKPATVVEDPIGVTYVSSGCGLDIGIPSTSDSFEGEDRKWVFQEYPANRNAFPILDQKALPTENIQAAFVRFKDPDADANDEETGNLKPYPGLDIRCADNPRGLTLETFAGLLTTNQDLEIEIDKENYFESDSGVKLEFITINFEEDGRKFQDPGYIGVSDDGQKLIYIIYYSAAKDDPNKEQIDKDINSMFKSLRYGSTYTIPLNEVNEVNVTNNVTYTQPVYAAPSIKPGDLGSQEWIDNFNKEFEETKRRTEESRAKMCEQNPDFC